ncbi:MAG: hypothetical protein ACOYXT_12590 [Bacteroidota bacterium]
MKKFCAYCGDPFHGQRRSRLYCSDKCKQMAFYKRNANILHGSETGAVSLPGQRTLEDQNPESASSFISRLTALVEEEVARRVALHPANREAVKRDVTINGNEGRSDVSTR